MAKAGNPAPGNKTPSDICLVLDGGWPLRDAEADFRLRQHIASHPAQRFEILCLGKPPQRTQAIAQDPRNLVAVRYAGDTLGLAPVRRFRPRPGASRALAEGLQAYFLANTARAEEMTTAWQKLTGAAAKARGQIDISKFVASERLWNTMSEVHAKITPDVPLADFYTLWRSAVTRILEGLLCALPAARVYHGLGLGLGGFVAARAAHDSGCPLLLWDDGAQRPAPRAVAGLPATLRLDLECKFAGTALRNAERIATPLADRRDTLVALGARPGQIIVTARAVQTGTEQDPAPVGKAPAPCFALADASELQNDTALCLRIAAEIRRALPDADVLLYVGQGRDSALGPDHCADLADYGLSSALTIVPDLGPLPGARRPDLLILPQARETLPHAALLAGAAGVPVLSSSLNPAAQLVDKACVLEDASAADFAQAATRLLMNPDALAASGTLLRERVERRHALSRQIAIYDRLYRELMAPGALARRDAHKEAA